MTADGFTSRLRADCGLLPGSHVLVALSGGADSTALLCLFLESAQRLSLKVSCAHVEHGIRGEASLRDLDFVRALCREKGVPLYTAHLDAPAYAAAHGCGMEEAARTLRYDFLHRAAKEAGADAIALAHHALDQAETVLMRAMRGSDLRGLCAMRWRSGRLIRPLLDVTAQELRAYLKEKGQPFCEDETNADTVYLRNRIRHVILPRMEKAVPGSGDALCRLARAAQRDEDYFAGQIDALNIRAIPLVDGIAIEKKQLLGLHPALCSRVLVRLMEAGRIAVQRSDVIEAIMDSLASGDAAVNLSGDAHAVIGRAHLCLIRKEAQVQETSLNVPGLTHTPFGLFEVRPALPGETGDGKHMQRIPGRLLEGAVVGARRRGETMIPFGRKSPVKIKKLMIDAGIERAMRKSVPVLRCDDTVLFAVGLRPAQCCRSAEDEEQMMVRFWGYETPDGRTTNETGGQNHD